MTLPAIALSLLAGPALAQSSVDQFELGGSARVLDAHCIRLTPDEPYLTGSAWFQQAIDLSQGFEMRMSLVLGSKDLQGADGIVFVFHPAKQTGFRGEGMGFAGLRPSLGIEFDTYRNDHLADPDADHLAVMQHGRSFHSNPEYVVPLGNLEDGERHPLQISWSPRAGELEVRLDGVRIATYPAELITGTFGSTTQVYWGMTAATGRLSNAQDVCIDGLKVSARPAPTRRHRG